MFYNIRGFDEYYSISKDGRVKSNRSGKILKPRKNTAGYYQVFFHVDGIRYSFLLHRLLAYTFKDLPCLYSELEVDHVDTDIDNFSLENLQVMTSEDHLSKTLAHMGKSRRKTCSSCGKKLGRKGYNKCRPCKESKADKLNITLEDIEYWVKKFSWSKASRELGMSDNGLRKVYRKYTNSDPNLLK